MERKIIYIINPISGTGGRRNLHKIVERRSNEAGISFQVFPSVASGDYSFLKKIIEEEQITDIVIAGGDGTVSQVVGSLHKTNLNFGIIPCGSGNGLALAAGISKNPERALDVIFGGHSELTDAFVLNGQFACMLSGLGFDAKVAHDFAKQPKRGLSTYIRQVFRNFLKAKTYRFRISSEKKQLDIDAYFVSIANANQFGNHFTIAPKASLDDGLLDIVIMASPHKLAVLWQTLQQVGGFTPLKDPAQINKKKGVIYFQADKIIIENLSQAPLHIDGDPAETPDTVDVKVKKGIFRLLKPVK
ncbi:hypothetical protein JMG10_15090 [Nostoc ellipsosporum NOK]|nr:hypothetical protein [Nostoc ellipsosporum NOK]